MAASNPPADAPIPTTEKSSRGGSSSVTGCAARSCVSEFGSISVWPFVSMGSSVMASVRLLRSPSARAGEDLRAQSLNQRSTTCQVKPCGLRDLQQSPYRGRNRRTNACRENEQIRRPVVKTSQEFEDKRSRRNRDSFQFQGCHRPKKPARASPKAQAAAFLPLRCG